MRTKRHKSKPALLLPKAEAAKFFAWGFDESGRPTKAFSTAITEALAAGPASELPAHLQFDPWVLDPQQSLPAALREMGDRIRRLEILAQATTVKRCLPS